MVFDKERPRVTVPNVNIEDCNYTIAFWIRSTQLLSGYQVKLFGSSRFGKGLFLLAYVSNDVCYSQFCREVSPRICLVGSSSDVVLNNWTLITVTCEQDDEVKMFFNGEIVNPYTIWQEPYIFKGSSLPPTEFVIDYFVYASPVIVDLHILGFALPRDEIFFLYRG